jgi:hypothetical protein
MVDSITVEIEVDGETGEIDVPTALLDALSEPDDSPVEVVLDVTLMSFAGRAHALLHHTEGEPSEALQAAEAEMLDRFEDRFGITYAEATGHSH